MAHSAVPADTDPTAFAILSARWSAMSIGERAELVQQLCLDVEQLARAGIHARHPGYSEIEICHELARRRYGSRRVPRTLLVQSRRHRPRLEGRSLRARRRFARPHAVVGILRIHADVIDRSYLVETARQLDLGTLLDDATNAANLE